MKRLLVVEEDPESMEMLKEYLRDRYHASFCESNADAVVALDGFQPHLILLDVTRRPADAINFLASLREFSNDLATPVIAMMENLGEADIRPFLAAGFQAVVSRPAHDPFSLYGAIDHFLSSADRPGTRSPGSEGIRKTASDAPP